jgi:hypothetical protein
MTTAAYALDPVHIPVPQMLSERSQHHRGLIYNTYESQKTSNVNA